VTLTPAFLDELRARTSLSALIARTTKLTRAGRAEKRRLLRAQSVKFVLLGPDP